MSDLTDRLNEILPKLTSDDFLHGKGIGNEIAFYIFDYLPEDELAIREHVQFLLKRIPQDKPGTRVKHVDLLDFVVDHLRQRNLLDKTFLLQKQKGDAFLRKEMEKILHPNKLIAAFAAYARPDQHDLVLVSGVGSVYPFLRAHTLLNNLQPVMGKTPLVLFYPGKYDRKSLKPFNRLNSDNYYRAFKLIS